MKISTKGDYAARALQDLAMHYDQGPIPIERIASRQGLPLRYLEQLLLTLKRAGFLSSKRGVNGGYSLAKPPAQITLGEVLRTVDAPIEPIYCVGDPPRLECAKETDCVLRGVWAEVGQAVSAIVDRTTLQDLCDRVRARTPRSGGGSGSEGTATASQPTSGP
jgi:Rrf2 family transcriptional regulator, cysteine metabolism repressor